MFAVVQWVDTTEIKMIRGRRTHTVWATVTVPGSSIEDTQRARQCQGRPASYNSVVAPKLLLMYRAQCLYQGPGRGTWQGGITPLVPTGLVAVFPRLRVDRRDRGGGGGGGMSNPDVSV